VKSIVLLVLALSMLAVAAVASPDTWKAEGWNKTDFSRTTVDLAEVLSGGPPKDGIPAIDEPRLASVAEANSTLSTDPVVSVEINGDARAYPFKILIWHEIANDTVGNMPVTITYCPLCNAAIVFDRRLDGMVLDFGTTGKLRHSDLIMYDRQSESWWQQFTGEGIAGKHAGKTLKMLPARIEAFSEFAARSPLGKVLVPNDPSFRDYDRNPYVGYDTSASPFLYRGDMPEGIDPMARVVVIKRVNEAPVIVAVNAVRTHGKFDFMGYTLTWKAGQSSALDTSQVSKGRDIGTIAVTESATGRAVVYDVVFAFAAHAFHPDATIMKE
jgi:Protein of unknown function (DUF3179)